MKRHHDSPVRAIDLLAVLLRGTLGETPLRPERGQPLLHVRGDRQHADSILARGLHPRGRDHRRDRDRHFCLQRAQMQRRIAQPVP